MEFKGHFQNCNFAGENLVKENERLRDELGKRCLECRRLREKNKELKTKVEKANMILKAIIEIN